MHEIWSVNSTEKMQKKFCYQMSSFKAKMHRILFRPGLRSLQRFPKLPSWISGGLLVRVGREMEGMGGGIFRKLWGG